MTSEGYGHDNPRNKICIERRETGEDRSQVEDRTRCSASSSQLQEIETSNENDGLKGFIYCIFMKS